MATNGYFKYILHTLTNCFEFRGRAGRTEYAYYTLFYISLVILWSCFSFLYVMSLLPEGVQMSEYYMINSARLKDIHPIWNFLLVAYTLFLFYAALSIISLTVRRFRDTGYTFLSLLFLFAPFAWVLLFPFILFKKGKPVPVSEVGMMKHRLNTSAPAEYAYAKWEMRLIENIIDGIVIIQIFFILLFIIYQLIVSFEEHLLLYVLIIFVYYFLLEYYANGKTVGKLILGTRVVDINGERPSAKSIAIRTLCRFIPFEAISFISAYWLSDHTLFGNWHDSISKTYVVNDKLLKEYKRDYL